MKLTELLESDLNTFFNLDEFSEEHLINSTSMNVIIDKEQLKERTSKLIGNDGLYNVGVLLFVKKADYGTKPVIGERITIDDDMFNCSDISEEGMLYCIELVAIDS